jgi:tryptophan halogenase
LLLGGALDEPFDDWSKWLPEDRALAISSARADGPITPYTRSTALSVGWQWRIPLQHRIGSGHVFSSSFSSESEAEERLFETLDTPAIGDPRLIKFRMGRRHRAWVGNVVGIGLAAGFLEPLESTSIHLVQASIERLVKYFPTRNMDPSVRNLFNRRTREEWERVRDFIITHYHVTQREDSEFWRYCKNMEVPDSVSEILATWKERGILAIEGNHLFQLGSWSAVMIGQEFVPSGPHALVDRAEPEFAAEQIRKIVAEANRAAAVLPTHDEFIARYCPAPADQ